MVFVENQSLLPYTAGTIQMVPGRSGYELANQTPGRLHTSPEARYRTPQLLDEKYETTYTENRRLSSSGTSDVGSFIDVYA